jgi:hypothetical protein
VLVPEIFRFEVYEYLMSQLAYYAIESHNITGTAG